jgi:hypothetical protein
MSTFPHLEAGVLGEAEAVRHSRHGVAPVCVSGDILVGALHSNLEAGAAIGEHLAQVGGQAVVGPRLDGQPNALGGRLLAVPAPHARRSRLTEAPLDQPLSLLLLIRTFLNRACQGETTVPNLRAGAESQLPPCWLFWPIFESLPG